MPYRICLISLGCAKNQVNSEQMLYLLNQAGHEVVGEVGVIGQNVLVLWRVFGLLVRKNWY